MTNFPRCWPKQRHPPQTEQESDKNVASPQSKQQKSKQKPADYRLSRNICLLIHNFNAWHGLARCLQLLLGRQ